MMVMMMLATRLLVSLALPEPNSLHHLRVYAEVGRGLHQLYSPQDTFLIFGA